MVFDSKQTHLSDGSHWPMKKLQIIRRSVNLKVLTLSCGLFVPAQKLHVSTPLGSVEIMSLKICDFLCEVTFFIAPCKLHSDAAHLLSLF